MRRTAHIALQAIGWILDLIGIFGIPDDLATASRVAERIAPYVENPLGRAVLLILGTTILVVIYGRWLARRWSPPAPVRDQKTARAELLRRWREAALAAQDEADELEKSRKGQPWPDNMIGVHEAKHILEKRPEYHEFRRVYRKELLQSSLYKRWRRRARINRLLGRPVKPLSRNPDRTSVVGTQLHSHVYYMLQDISRLEAWWNLDP